MSSQSEFNPTRMTLARLRRGLTKKALGAALGVDARMISYYEGGRHAPKQRTVGALARTLDFPIEFFYLDNPAEIDTEVVSFRALSRMSARQRDSARAAGVLAVELANWIDERFDLPSLDLPDFRGEDPVAAAETVRIVWGLGEKPIVNVIHLLESVGVRVFSVAEERDEIDAFSFWEQERPFVLLNTTKSAERSRFDATHELAHLVLHRHDALNRSRRVEHEANLFASAFLMPDAGVRASAIPSASLTFIHREKGKWGVSAMAYTRRLHDLGYLSEWHYRSRCKVLSGRGYRSAEHGSTRQRETSQLLGKVFRQLRDRGISRRDVAADLGMSLDDLSALMFGLVMTPLAGGGSSPLRRSKRPDLREVT